MLIAYLYWLIVVGCIKIFSHKCQKTHYSYINKRGETLYVRLKWNKFLTKHTYQFSCHIYLVEDLMLTY